MKRICKSLSVVLAVSTVSAFGAFAGCKEERNGTETAVCLVPIANPADISPALNYDYYLTAEPLASAKVKATASTATPLHIVADLQELYGGENGYPQAVLVAKSSFIAQHGAWVDAFMEDMIEASSWLSLETTEISSVVNAVSAHLTEGMTPSLSEKNLTKAVIENCGVRFVSAIQSKTGINAFLEDLLSVDESSAKRVADSFFYSGNGQGALAEDKAKVVMPDGAPALAMAKFMHENRADCEFEVVNAGTIATFVTGENPKADLCVLPLNVASKLLGNGEKYKLLGTVTHGNLYLLSTDKNAKIESADKLSALLGKKVGTIQINNIPGLTLKLLLKKNGVKYEEQI